jgi:hypothetical protein
MREPRIGRKCRIGRYYQNWNGEKDEIGGSKSDRLDENSKLNISLKNKKEYVILFFTPCNL